MNNFQRPEGTAFSARNLDSVTLSKYLCVIVSLIQNSERYSLQLQRYEDWWEHDGLHFEKEALSLHQLFEMVGSPRSLLRATPDDEFVFVGIGPTNDMWYLRFRLEWSDDGFDLVGGFDFVVPKQWETHFEAEIVTQMGVVPEKSDSDLLYRRIIL